LPILIPAKEMLAAGIAGIAKEGAATFEPPLMDLIVSNSTIVALANYGYCCKQAITPKTAQNGSCCRVLSVMGISQQ
jgi:hypothetical protein